MKKYLFALAALTLLFSCTPEDNNSGTTETPGEKEAPSVTIEANHISAISAVLVGKANLGASVSSDLSLGFQYSKSAGILPSNSTTVEVINTDADYNYRAPITGLDPNTTYYFRSFSRQNGQDTCGETKRFSTKEVVSLLETREPSDIDATKATMNAQLDLTDVPYNYLSYGFVWGTSETALNEKILSTGIKHNAYTASLTNLSHKTQYWYRAFVTLDSQTFYGEVKTFTTDVVKVESVSLDKTEHAFNTIGHAIVLKATVLPADATDKSLTWASNNVDVATVDANGKVTANGNGNATITVTTKDQGKTATCVVTVAQWVTSISLSQTSLTLNEGQTANLSVSTVAPDNANDKSVTWTSSDESIASVDGEGKVTAKSKGTATIKATAADGSGKYASCSVTVKRLVSSIQLDKTFLTLYRGNSDVSETINATIIPSSANNASVTWTSSDPVVATVSSSGVITGVSRGHTTITVTANDESGISATCEVEVKQYVTSISLSTYSLSLMAGEEETITVTSILPDEANDKSYTWTSSDDAIASVNNNGKITAKARGNAVIKATANDGGGVSASCALRVMNPCPAGAVDLGLSVCWATCNLGEGGFVRSPEAYGDYYAWGETETKENYSWETYKFGTSSDGPFSKYNTSSSYGPVDKKTVLDPEDDAAHVILGGNWRMPTYAEWKEILNNCTWTWTDNYNGTGIAGRIVTSNVEGYKDKSIFLPAAGGRDRSGPSYADSRGCYWSSSLSTSDPRCALCGVGFDSDRVYRGHSSRGDGLSVRPVSE